MKIESFVIAVSLLFWPIALFVTNNLSDFTMYVIPALLIFVSFLLYKKKSRYFVLPTLLIPMISPKLLLFPIIFSLITLVINRNKINLIIVFLSLILVIYYFNKFIGQSIFVYDYEAGQKIVRDTQLYDSIILARIFHNKARVVVDKFTFNLFAITDPANYFFSFHPREIATNQNLVKFPFTGIIFVLYGLYLMGKNKDKLFIVASLTSGIISLCVLTMFDRNDFIMFAPLSLVFITGITEFANKVKYAKAYLIFMIILIIPDLIRILLKI